MSKQAVGYASEPESLPLRQIAGSYHEKLVTIGFHAFDDGIDDVAGLHLRHDRESFLDEIISQRIDERGGAFQTRLGQFGLLGWG